MGQEAVVSEQVIGLSEAIDDRVAALLIAGTGITLTYNDGAGTLTIASTVSPTWGSIGGTLSSQTDLQAALDGKSNTGHTHVIANVTGLQTALDAKIGGNVGSTNNRIVRASGTGGLTVKTSGVEIDDSGRLLVDTIFPLTQAGVVLGFGTGNAGAIAVNQFNVTLASATGVVWSSTTNLNSGADIGVYRIGSGQLDFRGSSFRFRNYANSADAPVTASLGTFSTGIDIGADFSTPQPRVRFGTVNPSSIGSNYGNLEFRTGSGTHPSVSYTSRVIVGSDSLRVGETFPLQWRNSGPSGGATLGFITVSGSPTQIMQLNANGSVRVQSDGGLAIRNQANSADAGISASSAIFSALVTVGTYTVATLPSAAANAGALAQVTDSSVTANGSAVAGGGSNRVVVFSNGSTWDVVVA